MKIHLNNMVFYGFHGVYPEERKLGQRFNVSITLQTENSLDAKIKELNDTVDYTKVYKEVKHIMEIQQFQLLEDCANTIINKILDNFPLVIGIKVTIEKPGVPMNAALSSVAVEMERGRGDN